jgi:hypothetical protein
MDDSEVALATLGVIANSDAIHDRNPHRSQATKLAQIATAKNWRQNWRQTQNAKQPRQAKHLTGLSFNGARDQIRTGDPHVGNDMTESIFLFGFNSL